MVFTIFVVQMIEKRKNLQNRVTFGKKCIILKTTAEAKTQIGRARFAVSACRNDGFSLQQKMKGRDRMKRIISLIMVLVLALSLVPTTVWATEGTPADAVASVTDGSGETQKFASLQEAFQYADNNDVVTLLANVTTDAAKTGAADRLTIKKDVTLELNGYTMTIPGELEASDNWAAFYINAGTLTVKDSSANKTGAIVSPDKTKSGYSYLGGTYLFHLAGGNLIIENGTYYAGCTVANVQKGTATVKGGSFSVCPDNGTNDSRYLLNCIDASYKDGTAKIVVTGGTFTDFNPQNNAAEGAGTSFVDADKYTVTEENGKFTVNEREYVAQVGADKYYSLEDAINNVKNGQTIELIKDVTDAVGLSVNTHKTFTVDFKGHTYTVNKPGAGSQNTETNAFQLLKDQTITFKNGTINVSKDNLVAASDGRNIKRIIQCYAGLTLEDMLIDGTNVFGNGYPMTFNNQPVYIIGNTSVICNSATTTAFDADGNWDGYDRCKVTIDTTGTIGGDIELGQGYLDIRNVKAERIVLCKLCGETDFENRISVTGGTFSSNPTDYVHDEHYKVSKGLDGMYTVGLKYKDDGTGGKTSVVELPAETTKNTTTATIDVADIDANKELSVVGGDVSVTFDQNAAAGIADAAGNSTKLNLTVEKTEPSAEQEKTYDDKLVNTTHEVVVNVTLTADDGKPVFDAAKAGGKATVQVPYQVGLKKADISVHYLNNGKTEKVPFTYDAETGIITMTLEHFSAYLITTATHPSITPVDSKPTYIKGSNKDLGFTTVDLPEKITVKVGDKTLTEGKDYTVSDGKLTLTGAYLETLDYGNYTLKVFDENGNEIAKTSFAKSFAARPAQQPAQSGNKNSTSTKDDVKSAGTGDMGVALYAVSAVLSLTGSAWIVGKKRSK